MKILLEWAVIVLALFSLWPVWMGYQALWYRGYLVVIMLILFWVARNRLARIRQAAAEAQRRSARCASGAHDQPVGRGAGPAL